MKCVNEIIEFGMSRGLLALPAARFAGLKEVLGEMVHSNTSPLCPRTKLSSDKETIAGMIAMYQSV